ncbi:hypothetical protein KJ782_01150 [Patescibacteria group bacterium]|nr:hypothetical protein [Patescibacteria group bacterium]
MLINVADVLDRTGGKGVLFLRHGKYESRHAVALCDGDVYEMLARNYSRRIPDSFFPLSDDGIRASKHQGCRMRELGIIPREIVASKNGRGPHTGICIAQGIAEQPVFAETPGFDCQVEIKAVTGGDCTFIPVKHDIRVDYPEYRYEGLTELLRELDTRVTPQWLNGQHRNLCTEDALNFKTRSEGLVGDLITRKFTVVTSHYEQVCLLHALFVVRQDLGSVSEDWSPTYNQGVLIVEGSRDWFGFDVNPDLTLMGEVDLDVIFSE